MLRSGRAQEECRGLPDRARDAWRASKGDPDVWNDDRGPPRAIGLASSGGVHACGDGEHRGLLEADLQPPGGSFHTALDQRPAHQDRPGPQDRRQRLRVDRRSTQARSAAGQLCARTTPKGVAGTGPLSDHPGAGALSSEVARLHKTLEGANIKLASVATDIMGKSARQMLKALIDGSSDTSAMAQLAVGKLRAKIPQLERALQGCSGAHQRFLVAQQLAHIDFLEETIEQLSAQIAERMRPF